MKLNGEGQVTIPAPLRAKRGLREGDQGDVVEQDEALRIVRAEPGPTVGARLVQRVRGRASTTMSTDGLMVVLHGE